MALLSGTSSDGGRRDEDTIEHAALLELSGELVQVASPNGLLRYVNRAWREALGYEDQDIQRVLVLDVVHPDHEQHLSEVIRDVARQQTAQAFTSVLVTRDGEPLPVAGRMDCQMTDGQPVFMRAVMRDLRAERSAEAALDALHRQFQSAFESPAIGMAVQSLDGRWEAVNDALAQILGYAPGELIQMTYHDITYPDDLDRNVELLQRLLAGTERRFQMEKRYIHRDGSIVSVILTVSIVTDRPGKPLRFVSQIQDITARRQLETQLMHKATHDVLTGLPNRALFMDRLEHALTRIQRNDGQIAVMFLDLDGFKAVNDEFGHEQGDRLLVEIGRRLRSCARAGDTVARLGGDEFIVLMPRTPHEEALTIAARLAADLDALPEASVLGFPRTHAASYGVSTAPADGATAATLLEAADARMYTMKRAGHKPGEDER